MKEEVIIAGFGGQGIMLMGKVLAHAAMKEGFEVSWMPSYGPEMRGGTANCTVIISTEKIASPLSFKPDSIIIMNYPSYNKFKNSVKSGGDIILNSSLIDEKLEHKDINNLIEIAANELAKSAGNDKIANMVILGAYLENKDYISINTAKESIKELISGKWVELISLNQKALEIGAQSINISN